MKYSTDHDANIRVAESIASHIILMIIRALGIREITKSNVTFEGLEDVDSQRLDFIIERLSGFNAGQMLDLVKNEIDIFDEIDGDIEEDL